MSSTTWTTEQMLSLAPDSLSARAAEKHADARDWPLLGRSKAGAWGEFRGRSLPSYYALVTLPDLALSCSCPARKQPCRHALALSILLAREPHLFADRPAPSWVGERLSEGLSEPPLQAGSTSMNTESAYLERLAGIKRAMTRFQLWLKDIVHGGLGDLPLRPVGQWNEMATLLSGAGAFEVAADVRDLRAVAGKYDGWPQEALRRLGRLYLLTQAFAAYDGLAVEQQADLRAAAGWFPDPASPGNERVDGRWLVIGSAHQAAGRYSLRRTWLYGADHQRYAFVERQSDGRDGLPMLLIGAMLTATLRFAPGAWPLRAAVERVHNVAPSTHTLKGADSLRQARAAYGNALSMNPWLRRFPMALRGVQAELDGGLWVLRDREGYLMPLPQPFLYGWHLQALHGLPKTAVFGEWNGLSLAPLAVTYRDRLIALHVLRGQK